MTNPGPMIVPDPSLDAMITPRRGKSNHAGPLLFPKSARPQSIVVITDEEEGEDVGSKDDLRRKVESRYTKIAASATRGIHCPPTFPFLPQSRG